MRLGEAKSDKELNWQAGGTSMNESVFIGHANEIIRVKDNDQGLEFALLTIDASGNVETPGAIRTNDKFNVSGTDGATDDVDVIVPTVGTTTLHFIGGIFTGWNSV